MSALLELQSDILRSVALGHSLAVVADTLCRRAEALADTAVCSILTVDDAGLLHPLAGPSLPEHYSAALDGFASGPCAGSCGTAVFRRREVVVTDIASDPLWEGPRALALPLGFRACWSSPILAEDGSVVATFAFYFRTCRGPTETERRIVRTCVDLCAITIRHQRTQAHVTHLAYTDPVTNLPNRTAFEGHVAERLRERGDALVGLHYLDLDDFKAVNDTLGHRVGDLFLRVVGERVRAAVGEAGFVARLGGDEFAICCWDADPTLQEALAQRVLAALGPPAVLGEHRVPIGASIGIACAPAGTATREGLTRDADLAMYEAKRAGGNTYRLFSEELGVEVRERAALRADLRAAVTNAELELFYQPILEARTGAVRSFEALVRWRHPVRGLVSPDRFIPLAEEIGAIEPIGAWVVDRAVRDAATWPAGIGVGVNVSPRELARPGYALRVASAVAEAGLPPGRLTLELTETALFDRGELTRRALEDLKALGVVIALDDFGTGYSSLSLVRDRRFTKLKIDKIFVDGLGFDPDCGAIVKATIDIAREMGFRTTAEGVETPAQLTWLRSHGCDEVQGYLLGRPMPAGEIAGYLERRVRAVA